MEKLRNHYTAQNDQEILTIAKLKEIINQIPEEELGFEVVCVDKLGDELRGIPVANVITDVEGKQFAIFNFVLINRLRMIALSAVSPQQNQEPEQAGNQ